MQEKVIVITGASSGIGRATALLFAEKNAKVVALGRDEGRLNALSDEAEASGGTLKIQIVDVLEPAQVEKTIDNVIDDFGQIDVLVNAAGIILNGTIENTTLEDWDKLMNVNLRSVFYTSQKCVPHLAKTKGNIVNVSSVAGLRAFPNVLAYCVSKAAIDQLTRCSALELAPQGVRVNSTLR